MNHSFETGIITDKLEEFFDQHDIEVEISVTVRNGTDLFDATAIHIDKRLGIVRTHYVVRLDGNNLKFL